MIRGWFVPRLLLAIGAIGFSCLVCFAAPAVSAAECPGHPNALGTSRTLVVDPREHPRIGTMQYAESLPLADHEVVLTFDDGPLPQKSNQILDILAAQCVKATFFEIGRMAKASPEGIRKLRDAGHTIGTHTQDHPLSMNHMAIERARQEIEQGIDSVKAALGDSADASLAPFFRIPGLLRADNVEQYLAAQGIQIWSADFLADDWHHISSSRVYELAIKRLEARRKGILLLHDIQARTVAALPRILTELKARGYRIVHVVPATADRPATPTEPQQWLSHPPADNGLIAHWPRPPTFEFADLGQLPAPALPDLDQADAQPIALAEIDHRSRAPAPWPQQVLPPPADAASLPAPDGGLFEMPIGLGFTLQKIASASREHAGSRQRVAAAQRAPTAARQSQGASRRAASGHGVAARHRRIAPEAAVRAAAPAAHRGPPYHGPVKRLVQVKKKNA
jgi:peptidoglycan/xylan/chitin deacetylase (PgdA/CDA1 family)